MLTKQNFKKCLKQYPVSIQDSRFYEVNKSSTEGEAITDTTITRSRRREIAAYFFETTVLPRSEIGISIPVFFMV